MKRPLSRKHILSRILIVAIALTLTGCTNCQVKRYYSFPLLAFGYVPVGTTWQESAASTTGVTVKVHQPNGAYNEVEFSSTRPYGVIGSANGLAAILAEGTKAYLGSSAGPANVGRASQLMALGDFKGDGTLGAAYIPISAGTPNSVAVAFATSQLAYGNSRSYVIGAYPKGVIAADFNGDGKTDIAVAFAGDGTNPGGVAILLSNSDGTFAAPVNYAAGFSPVSLAALDLNHDGKLDLAVVDNGASPGKVYVLLGTGSGTFTAGGSYATGSYPLSVTIADFNGDGNPDLAVTANDNTATILLGAANGTFAYASSFATGANPQYIAAGDFNKDGKMDLAVANARAQTVSTFLGNGNGAFQAGLSYVTSYAPESLVITDYDGDGNLDIIQGSGDARVIGPGVDSQSIDILLGNGDGTFQGAVSMAVPASQGAVGTFLAAADFNGDAKIDVILNDKYGGNLYLFPGDGQGGFRAPVTIDALATGTQTGPAGAAAGDFNGDGKADLAVTESFTGKVAVLLNSASGLQLSGTFSSGGSTPGAIVAADFNGDGKLDLAVANAAVLDPFTPGNLTVFFGDGHGGFQLSRAYSAGNWPVGLAVADLNGDGKPDLIVTDNGGDSSVTPRAQGAVYVFLNDGHGGFQTPTTLTVGAYPSFASVGDVNGDGRPDLVVSAENANVTYTLSVLPGNGDGTFQAPVSVSTEYSPSGVVIGDFNGDGKKDLFVSHCCGATYMTYLQGNGDGSFQQEFPFSSAANSFTVAATDLNGDGKPDLIVGGTQPLSVTSMLNNVNTVFGITKTHTGSFTAGQNGATYSVVVSNAGSQATSGIVTVTDVLPSGLTPVSMAGTGWNCTSDSCTRRDALNPGATYPAITVTVNVNASAPSQVTNQVGVSGGGAVLAIASDPTTIVQAPAAPTLVNPANGATGVVIAPMLAWNASAGAMSYDVYFGTASTPPLVTNTTGITYAPATLSANTTYYWQIVAKNASGSAGSPTWSFTTTATAAAGLHFVAVAPCRVADTRGASTMPQDSKRDFPIPHSGCGIPASALAYSLNVTAVPPGYLGYLSLWPTGQPQPGVSTLNSWQGNVVANAAIVPAGVNGAVSVYVSNPTDVILDINGYFDNSTGSTSYSLYPATPCRVADTRGAASQFGGPSMDDSKSRDFPIPLGVCNIPSTARGYSLNFTVVPAGYLGFLTTWPTGQPQPNVSTLNSWTGKVVANAAIVPAGTNESVSVYVSNPTNVILDINGYFGQPGSQGALSFYPVPPCRVADTRGATGPFSGPEMGAQTTRSLTIPASACNIPSTAAAYSLNLTVVPDGYLGYLSVWPAGSSQPGVSTLNSWDGTVVANAAIVPAGTNGAIDIYVTNPTHVILDINGYFAP